VTLFGSIVISCTFVGTFVGVCGLALVHGHLGSGRASSHFSICILDCARCSKIMTTIFTSPLDRSQQYPYYKLVEKKARA
jgi:hypothetical protein